MFRRLVMLFCVAVMSGLLIAACGGGGDEGGEGASPETEETGVTEGAQVIDVSAMENAEGEVTYCQGADIAGNAKLMIEAFNEEFESQGLTARLFEFPADADQQRNQFIQRQEAQSGDCDVFSADVIWTAEFASQKWIYDMTPYMEDNADKYIPATVDTLRYDGKIWGVPETSDAGFIYYRTDQIDEMPATWQDLYAAAKEQDGIVFQGNAYEGLTVNFLELAFAAGGTVLNEDGTQATIDSPENLEALNMMVDLIQEGGAPKAVTTYQESESLRAFQTGNYTFLRNWPYAYAQLQDSRNVRGDFAVAPFPEYEGGGRAGILGGHNSVISVYSDNPGAALKLVEFIGTPEIQRMYAVEASLAPALSAAYDDPAVKEAQPFSAELKQAIEQAKPRPVSPVYPQISQAIYRNVNRALSGQMSPEEALSQAQTQIQEALETF